QRRDLRHLYRFRRLAHRAAHFGRHGLRINTGPKREARGRLPLLEGVEVDGARCGFTNVVVLRVAHYSYDLVSLVGAETLPVAVEPEMLSNGVAVGEVIPRHRLVDDGHARAALVLVIEVPPGEEWRAEGLEVLRGDPI